MNRLCVVLLALVLAGCEGPAGEPAAGFATRDIASAYLPLAGSFYLIFKADGAAMSLGEGIAVTNAHNANLIDSKSIIGTSTDYDLLFFHSDKAAAKVPRRPPVMGERVIAYGQGRDGGLRQALGVVTSLDAPVKARCARCKIQSAFTFEGDAGPGFSGGPVIDAADGHLVGIVFGYVDEAKDKRLIYAYPMARVLAELDRIEGKLPLDLD
jgi:S1-C subfamily serine protease